MNRYHKWDRQPRSVWPTGIVLFLAFELGIAIAVAGMLVWRAFLSQAFFVAGFLPQQAAQSAGGGD